MISLELINGNRELSLTVCFILYRCAFFTTEASNTNKADWLRDSLGRYNLFCNATTSQIQEQLCVKYQQFLWQQSGDEKLVKIAVKNVGSLLLEGHERRHLRVCPVL